MPRWLPRLLSRVHALAAARHVRLTLKALREAASLGLSPEDVVDVLAALNSSDFSSRVRSKVTAEYLYVFKPALGTTRLYLKLVVRLDCVVVSFHEDEGGEREEG